MEAITTTTTLWEILKNSKIVVPTFQRDYAQGRAGKEDLRKKFLKEIRKSLEKKSDLLLDFVYGTQKDDIIYPLDGQQRLTTLWVLMWYATFVKLANSKENELEERKAVLRNFTYETRTSSRDFIKWLCSDEFLIVKKQQDKEKSKLSLSDFIQKQTGFYSGWKQDPTIQSILRMLSGTQVVNKKTKKTETPHNDGIEQIFTGFDAGNFDRLFCNECPIKFYHLNLLGFKQPDNLYVKMNARGEQLTSFENFKADLIGECRKNSELKEYVDYNNKESYILTKWDNDWTQIFWGNRAEDKDSVDDLFFAFIKRFLLNRYVEKSVSTLQLQPIEVSDTERSLKIDDNYNSILFNLPEGANLSSVRLKLNDSNEEYSLILNNSSSRTCSIESEKGKSFQKGDYTVIFDWSDSQADSSSNSKSKKLRIKPKKKNGEDDPIVKLLYTNEQKEYTSYELYQTLIDKNCVNDLMNVLDSSLLTIKDAIKEDIPLLATSEQDESEDTQSQGNKAYSFIPQYAKDKNGKVLDLVKSASFAERIMMYGICRYLLIIKSTQQGQEASIDQSKVTKWLRVLSNLVYYNEIPNYAAYESRLKFVKGIIDRLGEKISDVYDPKAIDIFVNIADGKTDNDSIQLKEEITKIRLINNKSDNEQIIKKIESLWIFSGHINCVLKEEYLKDQLYESLEKIIGTKRTYVRDGDKSLLNLFRAILAKSDNMLILGTESNKPNELVFNDDHNNLRKLLNGTLLKPFINVIEEILDKKELNDIIEKYEYKEEEGWKYALIRDENLWQYATQGKCVKNGNEYFWYRGTYKNKADIPLTAYSKFIKDNGMPKSMNYIEKDDCWKLDYENSTEEFGKEENQKMRNN